MIFLLLFVLFQYSFQIMRSLCQEECEADVSIVCEADVKANAKPKGFGSNVDSVWKPMSRLMRSLCPEESEAYVKINAKPVS